MKRLPSRMTMNRRSCVEIVLVCIRCFGLKSKGNVEEAVRKQIIYEGSYIEAVASRDELRPHTAKVLTSITSVPFFHNALLPPFYCAPTPRAGFSSLSFRP